MITEEFRYKIFARDVFMCKICGESLAKYKSPQIAHSIKSGKGSENYIMNYIWVYYQKDRSRAWVNKYILDNEMNLSSVCSLSCNDACNIFFKPVKRDALIDKIITETRCLTDCSDK